MPDLPTRVDRPLAGPPAASSRDDARFAFPSSPEAPGEAGSPSHEAPEMDRFEKFASDPKFIGALKFCRNALTGGGMANMLMCLAFGGALHPIGIAVGVAIGVTVHELDKRGYLKPLQNALKRAGEKLADKLHIHRKVTARSKRMTGQVFDWVADSTFVLESTSALFSTVSHFASAMLGFLYPLNAVTKVFDLPLDAKNYEDVVKNRDPRIDPETRKKDLHAEFAHMACGFLQAAGAFVPPVTPETIALNVTLQVLGFAANRWRDTRDFAGKWLQGYDEKG